MRLIFLSLLFLSSTLKAQDLQIAEIFTDHAVLQHGKMLSVWGWAAPNSTIFLSIKGERFRGKTDENGRWKIPTAKWPVGGPFEMSVTDGTKQLNFSDLYFGDVWLCSGQSNMEWTVAQSESGEAIENYGTLNNIRHIKVQNSYASSPEEHLSAGNWEVATTENIGKFTGVGFHFARSVTANHDIPIGLLNTSWGGSRIEAWMSEDLLMQSGNMSDLKPAFAKQSEYKRLNEMYADAPSFDDTVWTEKDFDASDWKETNLPGLWENNGYEGMNGTVCFRKIVELTPLEVNNTTHISLAKIDDADETYINGKLIGKTSLWDKKRSYEIPPNVLQTGKNIIAVKVSDNYGGGGFHGAEKDMYLQVGNTQKSLAGEWKMKLGKVHFSLEMQHQPTILFNKMIYPLLDFPVRGALWYQGESNAGGQDAITYEGLFQDMITDWRKLWKDAEMPFYWVQLANFMQETKEANAYSNWATLRASQSAALNLSNTAEAVIIDVGEADDIHPKDKQTVGERLARAARAQVYKEYDLVYKNPRVLSAKRTVSGDVVLTFENSRSDLKNNNETAEINGFAIAGKDGVFHWAKGKLLEKNQVLLACKAVKEPIRVRYLWSDNPGKIDLYNTENLPVAPFLIDVIDK